MLDRVLLRRNSPGSDESYDAGRIAEALLFYGETHFVTNDDDLRAIIRNIGINALLRLLADGHIKITLLQDLPAIGTSNDAFDFCEVTPMLNADGKKIPIEERVRTILTNAGVKASELRTVKKKLLNRIQPSRLSAGMFNNLSIPELYRRQIRAHPDLLSQSQLIVKRLILPGSHFPVHTRFNVFEHREGDFRVDTDLDIPLLSSHIARRRELLAPYDPRDMLLETYDAFVELALGSRFSADVSVDAAKEGLMQDQLNAAFHRREPQEIEAFKNLIFDDGYGVREAINSGERSFDDFLSVLDRAAKFKKMLRDAHPQVGVLKAYQSEVLSGTWIERTIPKRYRFAFFASAGALGAPLVGLGPVEGAAFGVGLDYAEAYLLQKIRWGWKPNVFVQDVLLPFVKKDS